MWLYYKLSKHKEVIASIIKCGMKYILHNAALTVQLKFGSIELISPHTLLRMRCLNIDFIQNYVVSSIKSSSVRCGHIGLHVSYQRGSCSGVLSVFWVCK